MRLCAFTALSVLLASSTAFAGPCDDPSAAWTAVGVGIDALELGDLRTANQAIAPLLQSTCGGENPAPLLAHARAEAQLLSFRARAAVLRRTLQTPPRLTNVRTTQQYNTWSQQTMVPWAQAQRREVLAMHRSVHPLLADGTIPASIRADAAEEVAVLYQLFTNALHNTPLPPDIARNADLRAAFRELLTEHLEHLSDNSAALELWIHALGTREHLIPIPARRAAAWAELEGTPEGARNAHGQLHWGLTVPLTPDSIRAMIQHHLGYVLRCHEQALQSNPSLQGRVVIRFTVGADGWVTNSEIAEGQNLGDVAECTRRAITRVPFPQPANGTSTVVNYPFNFQPSQNNVAVTRAEEPTLGAPTATPRR